MVRCSIHSAGDALDDAERRALRYRMNFLVNGALRDTFDM